MSRVREEIEVAASADAAYRCWMDFEAFPDFMGAVDEVRREGDRLHWRASAAGHRKAWTAQITRDEPGRHVAWASVEGAANDGSVTFTPLDDARTLVALEMEVEPEGPVETAADAAGLLERQVRQDLERFRQMVGAR